MRIILPLLAGEKIQKILIQCIYSKSHTALHPIITNQFHNKQTKITYCLEKENRPLLI